MDQSSGVTDAKTTEPSSADPVIRRKPSSSEPINVHDSCKKRDCSKKKKEKKPAVKHKRKNKPVPESESDSSSDDSLPDGTGMEESSESDSDSSIDLAARKKLKKKLAKAEAKDKARKAKKQKKPKRIAVTEDEDSEVSDDQESDIINVIQAAMKARAGKKKTSRKYQDGNESPVEIEEHPDSARLRILKSHLRGLDGLDPYQAGDTRHRSAVPPPTKDNSLMFLTTMGKSGRKASAPEDQTLSIDPAATKPKKIKRASKVAYKRVDQLWDQSIHNFKLTETVKNPDQAVWDQYIFTVRRKFDWEHKYVATTVDIKSQPLKECLQHVMAGVKGISLVEDTPHLDPNMLFMYLEEMREYADFLDSDQSPRKKKEKKAQITKAQHLRVMVKYLDKDYAETKRTLYPLLESGMITFDLVWALWKPNSIAYCATYGDHEEPRAFRIDFANKESHFMRGSWYSIEGKYLEYDGKTFGLGAIQTEIPQFQGVRKITSLDCYPIQFHKDAENVRSALIERGKQFVSLQGMNYRYHKGMAFSKRKKQVLKIHVDGRVMIDPAIHRRINPNYPISTVKPKDADALEVDDDDDDCDCGDDSSEYGDDMQNTPSEDTIQEQKKFKVVRLPSGQTTIVEVNSKEDVDASKQAEQLADQKQSVHEFSEEELLIASPVVLGFAFGEKLWLEFSVSALSEVVFNSGAFDSLVLPDNQKSIIKALVSSHAFQAHRSIDDIISGKGRGLVAVLHGPPGTGKTLTAEGIADLLKCPLYMVSAGDLGTDPTRLEKELQNILDIAHSWGALLLLDEADVFLEQRSIHDIHRNALVSIFLRLLEYFQGILFLTTNRVETFDSAFVSRIHLSLRFQNLTTKAKRSVWKLFIDRVKSQDGMEVAAITDSDFNDLARREVNGRQIKNLVRAAQALAIHENVPLSMVHIRRVIDVAESFEIDLKGGTGYSDAMRSYT